MTIKTWLGGTGLINSAADWDPAGVPQATDTLLATSGNIVAVGSLGANLTLDLSGSSAASEPTLYMLQAKIAGVTMETTDNSFAHVVAYGRDTITSGIQVGSDQPYGPSPAPTVLDQDLTMDIGPFSRLDLRGSSSITGSSALTVNGGYGSHFLNDGDISLGGLSGANVTINPDVTGQGSFTTEAGRVGNPTGTLTFGGAVGSGETVNLLNPGNLEIERPSEFLGSVAGLQPAGGDFSTVKLDGIQDVVSGTLTDTSLDLFGAGGTSLAHLNLSGTPSSSLTVVQQTGGVTIAPAPSYYFPDQTTLVIQHV